MICFPGVCLLFLKTYIVSLFIWLFPDLNDTYSEGNTDTVGQIVQFIMQNEGRTELWVLSSTAYDCTLYGI